MRKKNVTYDITWLIQYIYHSTYLYFYFCKMIFTDLATGPHIHRIKDQLILLVFGTLGFDSILAYKKTTFEG